MSDTQRTVRARILVAVDTEGNYTSIGYSDQTDDDLKDYIILDSLNEGLIAYHWIEADIPVPVAPAETTVEGVVTDGGQETLS